MGVGRGVRNTPRFPQWHEEQPQRDDSVEDFGDEVAEDLGYNVEESTAASMNITPRRQWRDNGLPQTEPRLVQHSPFAPPPQWLAVQAQADVGEDAEVEDFNHADVGEDAEVEDVNHADVGEDAEVEDVNQANVGEHVEVEDVTQAEVGGHPFVEGVNDPMPDGDQAVVEENPYVNAGPHRRRTRPMTKCLRKARRIQGEENPAVTPKTHLNSHYMKLLGRYPRKGETVYECKQVTGGFCATVELKSLPAEMAHNIYVGEVYSTKRNAEQSAARYALRCLTGLEDGRGSILTWW